MLSKDGKLVVVTGATGQQGGALVDALGASAAPWRVRVITRNVKSPSAKALEARGIELAEGDLNDPASLKSALTGAYGCYSVQPNVIGHVEQEVVQGVALAEAASDAKVAHFLYSSVGGAERASGVPHFETKWRVEQRIQKLAIPATILRPASFMDNYARLPMRSIVLSMMRTFMPEDRPLQLVAVRDIGVFGAIALARPNEFIGQALELAGDELTRSQIVETLRASRIRPVISCRLPKLLTKRLPEDFPLMLQWFAAHGFRADLPRLRAIHPGVHNLKDWAASLN